MLDGGAWVLHQPIVLEPVSANVGGSAIGHLDSLYNGGSLAVGSPSSSAHEHAKPFGRCPIPRSSRWPRPARDAATPALRLTRRRSGAHGGSPPTTPLIARRTCDGVCQSAPDRLLSGARVGHRRLRRIGQEQRFDQRSRRHRRRVEVAALGRPEQHEMPVVAVGRRERRAEADVGMDAEVGDGGAFARRLTSTSRCTSCARRRLAARVRAHRVVERHAARRGRRRSGVEVHPDDERRRAQGRRTGPAPRGRGGFPSG